MRRSGPNQRLAGAASGTCVGGQEYVVRSFELGPAAPINAATNPIRASPAAMRRRVLVERELSAPSPARGGAVAVPLVVFAVTVGRLYGTVRTFAAEADRA
jgi:hypothetical protein